MSARVARARKGPAAEASPSAPRDQGGAIPEATLVRATDGNLGEGSRVDHASFGPGTIVELRGTGRLGSALVRFDESAARVVILRYLRPLQEQPSVPSGEESSSEPVDEPVVIPFEDL